MFFQLLLFIDEAPTNSRESHPANIRAPSGELLTPMLPCDRLPAVRGTCRPGEGVFRRFFWATRS
jgi:hypothetical protein